jgi:hypothetical protein
MSIGRDEAPRFFVFGQEVTQEAFDRAIAAGICPQCEGYARRIADLEAQLLRAAIAGSRLCHEFRGHPAGQSSTESDVEWRACVAAVEREREGE